MKRLISIRIAAAALALFAASGARAQQQDLANAQITSTNLNRGGAYELSGPGGNITVVPGGDGIIMVDSQFAPLHDKIKAAIAAISQQPVKYIVNTHFHGDHTGGDAAFIKEGVTVVAHENVKKRLGEGTTNGLTGNKTPPVAADALPTKTYSSGTLTLHVKGRSARVGHIPNAHTDGDSYVYFPGLNILATGDTVTLGRYPNIDFANGGSIKGMIKGVDTYLKIDNGKTIVIPGHGPVANRNDLVAYRAFLVAARDRIAKLIKAGKSEQDAVAAHPFADWDAKYGANEQQSTNFTRVIYNSLKPKTT